MTAPNMSNGEISQEPLSAILMAVSQIDGVDLALALSRISGRQRVLEESLEQTSHLIVEKLPKIQACLLAEDLQGVFLETHGLRGALAGIGAMDYAEQASELEASAKAGQVSLCRQRYPLFAECMQKLALALHAAFPQQPGVEKRKGDYVFLMSILGKAAQFLRGFEADDALLCLNELEAFSFGDEMDDLLRRIKGSIKTFKYDEALRLLSSIL